MRNYLAADIGRVLHKPSFVGACAAFAGLFLLLVFLYFNPGFTADQYTAKIASFLSFFPLLVGLFVFMAVYADDFKCRSMQVAIGYGIPRGRIVLGKLLESAVLLFCAAAVLEVLVTVTPLVLGLAPGRQHLESLTLTVLAEMLRALGYTALATVPVFFFQNAVNGSILYVLLASKTVYITLTLLLGQDFVQHTVGDLTRYLYTTQLYTARELLLGNAPFAAPLLLALLGYVVLPTGIAAWAFYTKELEF